MRVVIADLTIIGSAYDRKTLTGLRIDKSVLFPGCRNPEHPIAQVLNDDDVGIVVLDLFLKNGKVEMELRKTVADTYSYNALKILWNRFREAIKISVYLKYASDETETLSDFASFQGMGIDPLRFVCTGSAIMNGSFFFHREPKVHVKIEAELNSNASYQASFNLAAPTQVHVSSHPIVSMNKIIFEEGFNSDVTIVAKNAVEIKAHQCFLSASSPVLKAMFKDWTMESQSRQVVMTDVAENVVRAFLRFLYFRDLDQVKGEAEVAFELIKMAEKYDVQNLKNEMSKILMEIQDGIIKVDLAFQMYMFTRNIDSALELKAKSRRILKANFDEMKALQEYKNLFIESPNVAMEVFEDFTKSA